MLYYALIAMGFATLHGGTAVERYLTSRWIVDPDQLGELRERLLAHAVCSGVWVLFAVLAALLSAL